MAVALRTTRTGASRWSKRERGSRILPCCAQTLGGDEGLSAWASGCGVEGLDSNVRVHRWENSLRGMQAVQRWEASEASRGKNAVVSVPQGQALEVTSLNSTALPFEEGWHGVTKEYWKEARWFVKLALKLLKEKYEAGASSFYPYVATLPKTFNTPFHWKEEELAMLQYPPLVAAVEKQRRDWTRAHAGLEGVDFDDFVWALECVRSRSFSGYGRKKKKKKKGGGMEALNSPSTLGVMLISKGPDADSVAIITGDPGSDVVVGGAAAVLLSILARDIFVSTVLGDKLRRYVLCPIIDHFNHRSKAKSDIQYAYWTNKFELSIDEPYESGEQVYISYGEHGNDELLQYYGFVEESNPFDTVKLLGATTNGDLANKESRREEIEETLAIMGTSLEEDVELLACLGKGSNGGTAEERKALALQYRIQKKKLLHSYLK